MDRVSEYLKPATDVGQFAKERLSVEMVAYGRMPTVDFDDGISLQCSLIVFTTE